MKLILLQLIISLLFFTSSFGQDSKLVSQSNQKKQDETQLEDLQKRFLVKYAGILSGNLWTLTHNYESKTEVDKVLKFLQNFLSALQTNDKTKLQEMGGVKGFKDTFLEFLKSEDKTVKGFAAIILGITGDINYAPPILALVQERDASFTDRFTYPSVTYRGSAAMALGILGAKEYIAKIALLLKSQNDYDRRGAISALSNLVAKEYAKDIVNLLTDKDLQVVDDVSPIYFLVETGMAKDYQKELIDVMLREFGSETAKAAIYTFVRLEAKENANDIAKLLERRFRKGDAAKALALLDAKEYSDKISLLLNDENSLVKKDSALALGILKAKELSSKVAELLRAKEDFVRYYAAVSLILMEAIEYYKEAIFIIEKSHQSGAYLNDGDFHPLVLEKSRQINADFKRLLEKAKSL